MNGCHLKGKTASYGGVWESVRSLSNALMVIVTVAKLLVQNFCILILH